MHTVVTHSGKFHADEVFALATLSILFKDDITISRTREQNEINRADIVVDVGRIYDPSRGRFDHHQLGAPLRADGKPYSSFGMVWKEFGERLCGDAEIARRIDERYVVPIDLADNGITVYESTNPNVSPFMVHNVIAVQRPTWKEDWQGEDGFRTALTIAVRTVERIIRHAQDEVEGEIIVEQLLSNAVNKQVIELNNRRLPWENILMRHPESLFVIARRDEEDLWSVSAVPKELSSFEYRRLLPPTWAGLAGEELARVCGVEDAVFCHKAAYLCVARSLDGARRMAAKALEATL